MLNDKFPRAAGRRDNLWYTIPNHISQRNEGELYGYYD